MACSMVINGTRHVQLLLLLLPGTATLPCPALHPPPAGLQVPHRHRAGQAGAGQARPGLRLLELITAWRRAAPAVLASS